MIKSTRERFKETEICRHEEIKKQQKGPSGCRITPVVLFPALPKPSQKVRKKKNQIKKNIAKHKE